MMPATTVCHRLTGHLKKDLHKQCRTLQIAGGLAHNRAFNSKPSPTGNSVSTCFRASVDDVNPPNPTVFSLAYLVLIKPAAFTVDADPMVHVSSLPAGTTGRRRCCRRSRRRRSCSELRRAAGQTATARNRRRR
jgi:hypothetical protein